MEAELLLLTLLTKPQGWGTLFLNVVETAGI
jgi:hypothetical protein